MADSRTPVPTAVREALKAWWASPARVQATLAAAAPALLLVPLLLTTATALLAPALWGVPEPQRGPVLFAAVVGWVVLPFAVGAWHRRWWWPPLCLAAVLATAASWGGTLVVGGYGEYGRGATAATVEVLQPALALGALALAGLLSALTLLVAATYGPYWAGRWVGQGWWVLACLLIPPALVWFWAPPYVDAVPSLSPGVLTTADLLPVSGAVAAVIALVLAAVGVGQTSSTGLPLPRSGRARRGAMDDGDRGWIARRGCVIVVLLPVCIGGLGLMLGGGMAGGIAGSLSALAGLSSLVAGLLLALGAVALTPAMRVPRQRTLWLFRLAAGALLLAAVLLSLVSFPDSLLLALFPALLAFALATPWWGRR